MRDSKLEDCQQTDTEHPAFSHTAEVNVIQEGKFSKSVLDGLVSILKQSDLQQVEALARNGDHLIVISR